MRDDRAGIGFAAFAYAFWGIMPIYWRLLNTVPPFEIVVHRILWCALTVAGITLMRGRFSRIVSIVRMPAIVGRLGLTALLITANWTIYVYCVATNQLVEASLGYYINPLISIAMGVILLGERLSRVRLIAMVLAAAAVTVQAFELGHIPWIAPALALSFGFYGYFRKLTPVDALDGLTIETWILFPVTLVLVSFWKITGTGAFPSPHISIDALLMLGGPLTALPLACFAAGVRRIRLSTLGFLQYFSPSITLVLAIFGFGERFTRIDLITFACVWAALALIAAEGWLFAPRVPQAP